MSAYDAMSTTMPAHNPVQAMGMYFRGAWCLRRLGRSGSVRCSRNNPPFRLLSSRATMPSGIAMAYYPPAPLPPPHVMRGSTRPSNPVKSRQIPGAMRAQKHLPCIRLARARPAARARFDIRTPRWTSPRLTMPVAIVRRPEPHLRPEGRPRRANP